MADGKKFGRWHGQEAQTFKEFSVAIGEVLHAQPPESTWVVEMEVKKVVGNPAGTTPIHDYRIVLSPGE
jgi:hypothetical protein